MTEDVKGKRPLSDLARETRRNNALRLNEKRRQAKVAAAPPAKTAVAKTEEEEEDPVIELIRRIVDERLEEKRSGSNLSALALLGVQMLANSSIVPSLVARLSKKMTEIAPSEPPSSGLDQWLNNT